MSQLLRVSMVRKRAAALVSGRVHEIDDRTVLLW